MGLRAEIKGEQFQERVGKESRLQGVMKQEDGKK